MDDLITISSSDSDSEFDTDDEPFNTNERAEGYGEQSGYISPQQVAMGSSDADFRSASQRNFSGSEYQKHSMELDKRVLPPSLSAAPSNYGNSDHGHQINGSTRPYSLAGPNLLNGKNREKENISRNNDNDVMMLDKGGTRILPPSLSAAPSNYGNSEHGHQINGSARPYALAGPSLLNGKNREKENISRNNDNDVMMLDKGGTRILPPSLSAAPSNYGNSEHVHQINGNARPYALAGPSLLNGKNREKENISRNNDNDVIMLDKGGTRILPPWTRTLPVSSGRYAVSLDSTDPFRTSDGATDERSVFREVMQDLNQPKQELEIPEGCLTVPLLRHQKIALAWMRQKEARPFCVGGMLADDQGLGKTVSIIALIQMEKHLEEQSKSEDHKNNKIEALNLDDDDDNGIAILDVVKLTEDSNGNNTIKEISSQHASSSQKSSSQQASNKQRPAAGTLVVCPATVLRQWARELDDKVTQEAKLKVLLYHGSNRTKDPSELATYDVVLTTYAIVTNEVPKQSLDEDETEQFSQGEKRKKPSSFSKKGKGRKGIDSCMFDDSGTLARVRWQRVVLDEAQTIKNHRTQVARACCGLRAKKRWCLSGTPIQNSIDELFSYFRFLKYDPYSSYKAFCEGIKGPISRDSKSGYQKLQIVLKTVMLRRTKGTLINGQPIINLPPKFVKMRSVEFTAEERKFYTDLETASRKQFKVFADSGTVNQNYASILLMLLRLRQACDHPHLVYRYGSDSVRKKYSVQTLKQLPKDKLMNLLNRLQSSPICLICADPPEDAVISKCGHVFCEQCISDHLNGDDNTCPNRKCKEQLSTNILFSKGDLKSCLRDDSESSLVNVDQRDENLSVTSKDYASSKIRAVLEIVHSLSEESIPCIDLDGSVENDGSTLGSNETNVHSSDPAGGRKKTIIFSQWTRMLDLMETSLWQANIHHRRLDGTMSLVARDKAVREFNTNPEVTVMLMSLKAGNLGLNMVAACHVILLDLWWNPTTEDQAVDRAHRIGQTRAVTVSRLTIKETVEDRILALQEEKRKMVAAAFGEENGGGSTRLTAQDLRFLFMGA